MIFKKEYEKRLEKIKKELGKNKMDALIVFSWKRGGIRYVTGYYPGYIANMALAVMSKDKEPILRIRFPFDLERARMQSWIEDISAPGSPEAMVEDVVKHIGNLDNRWGRIGLSDGDSVIREMPADLYKKLESNLGGRDLEIVDASAILSNCRLIKSEAEFEILRESAALVDKAFGRLSAELKTGMSDFKIAGILEGFAKNQGAGECLAIVTTDYASKNCSLPTGMAVHKDTVVIVEFGIQYKGYWTQAARVFGLGKTNEEERKLYRSVYAAYRDAYKACKDGVEIFKIAKMLNKMLVKKFGSDSITHDFGHGIGLDLPEEPALNLCEQKKIETGMALVIHPSVKIDNIGGAFVGGTVLITPEGVEPLHSIPAEL